MFSRFNHQGKANNTTLRFHFFPVRMVTKKTKSTNADEDGLNRGLYSLSMGRKVSSSHYGNESGCSSTKNRHCHVISSSTTGDTLQVLKGICELKWPGKTSPVSKVYEAVWLVSFSEHCRPQTESS